MSAVPKVSDPAEVIGRRIGAALIDIALMIVLSIVVGIVLGGAEASDGEASINLEGDQSLVFFALVFLYYFVTESAWGQTVGKRALGVVVVDKDSGAPAGAGKVVIRTLLRVVDALPVLYLLGLIVMLATGSKQRIGDLAAGTVVVARTPAQPPAGAAA
jgi:uncharacterized RDD family membrane protein YckC